jgi:DNA-binding MarR family transcriptional regulator
MGVAGRALRLRQWVQKNMGFVTSMVSYDVILVVCAHHERDEILTMKRLNSALSYSVSHIRRTIRALQSMDLVETQENEADRRNAVVKPTPKLLDLMNRFGEAARTVYGPVDRRSD